jgi:5-methylcytosine-specific restriction endonuclease McrA
MDPFTVFVMAYVNEEYIAYIRSSAWKELRKKALERDKHLCQVCKIRMATQVHHLTYARFGHELPEDLISICTPCHRLITKAHRSSPSLKSAPAIFM